MPTLPIQIAIQLCALAAAWLLMQLLAAATGATGAPYVLVLLQGVLAALAARVSRQPWWWQAIHLAFLPLTIAALWLGLPPWLYLAAFIGMGLVFWTTFRGEVPLFLSGRATAEAVLGLLPGTAGLRMADLGAGTGGLLRRLARARPDVRFCGVEHAPLPYLVARLNGWGLDNLVFTRGNLWRQPLAEQDLVFAFLSPRVMPRLWEKARAEMRPGTLLVSSCFPVPGIVPERVVDVPERRGTRLYCYRM